MSNPDKPRVIATRWWWVRHAPVREDDGCIYGQKDLGCDTSDRVVFDACRDRDLPVVVAMSGGYAPDVDAIVTIHSNTIREAVHSCLSVSAS